MEIDGFTFAAQIVNFLILVWLLKRFLYGPVLKAIDDRERNIAERQKTAEQEQHAAEQARRSYEQRKQELEHVKESLVSEATAEVESWKREALSTAREHVASKRRSWQEALIREQESSLNEFRLRTARQVQEVARHVLRELADQGLEDQTVRRFLVHLSESYPLAASETGDSRNPGEVVLRTAFPLTDAGQAAVQQELAPRVGNGPVRFDLDPELVCGVEMIVGDHKFQWNVDHYLHALEHSVTAALERHDRPTVPSGGAT